MALTRLDPGQLPTSTVAVQALDNQWVPKTLLARLFQSKSTRAQRQDEIDSLARIEFLRALLNARTVLVNRANLMNSVVFEDDLCDEKNRRHFGSLCSNSAIVPFLLRERALDEPPAFTLRRPDVLDHLNDVQRNYDVGAVRLSWDDEKNNSLSYKRVAARFHRFATDLHVGTGELVVALGLQPDEHARLSAVLREVRDHSNNYFDARGEPVTRQELYRKFVCRDDRDAVILGNFDPTKPYASELKQLLDLKYVLNMTDALQKCALTAQDSAPRSVLPFEDQAAAPPQDLKPSELVDQLLSIREYDFITENVATANVRYLTLEDIASIRNHAQWRDYIEALERLLRNPLAFHDENEGLSAVVRAWIPARRVIAEHHARRVGANVVSYGSTLGTLLSIGSQSLGTLLSYTVAAGKVIQVKSFRRRLNKLAHEGTRILGSFALRQHGQAQEDEAETEQQFIARKVEDGREFFEGLLEEFRARGIQVDELDDDAIALEEAAYDEMSDTTLPEE